MLTAVFAVTLFLIFWILPLILGLRLASAKGITRKWMLFAIHPFFTWIGYLIIAVKDPKRECPHCYAKIDQRADICNQCLKESPPSEFKDRNKNGHIGLAIGLGPIVLVGFAAMLFYNINMSFKDSWAYQEAWTRIEMNPEAQSYLGGKWEASEWSMSGHSSGQATRLSIPLKGAESNGKILIGAHQNNSQWFMDTLWLIDFGSGDTLDLSDALE